MMRTVADMWRTGSSEQLAPAVTGDLVFSSPVADYRGEEAINIVGLVAQTMNLIETTNHWDDGHGDSITAFTARVGDKPVDGVVREHRDAHGALTHITLFLRPLRALKEAIEHITSLRNIRRPDVAAEGAATNSASGP